MTPVAVKNWLMEEHRSAIWVASRDQLLSSACRMLSFRPADTLAGRWNQGYTASKSKQMSFSAANGGYTFHILHLLLFHKRERCQPQPLMSAISRVVWQPSDELHLYNHGNRRSVSPQTKIGNADEAVRTRL